MVDIWKLKFGQDFEAEFWPILEADADVVLEQNFDQLGSNYIGESTQPCVRCALGSFYSKKQSTLYNGFLQAAL